MCKLNQSKGTILCKKILQHLRLFRWGVDLRRCYAVMSCAVRFVSLRMNVKLSSILHFL